MMTLFIALESAHICQVPSFVGIKKVEIKHGVKISLIYPWLTNS